MDSPRKRRNCSGAVTRKPWSFGFDTSLDAFGDVFATKLNALGSKLAYSTFLGGTDRDVGRDIAVREDRAYVTGNTSSGPNGILEYPTTPGAFDTTHNGSEDAFVTKLPTG